MKSERIKQLKCSINFGELNISDYDYESVPWLSEYQLETKPTKLILSDGMNLELRNYPLDTIKELNLYCLNLPRHKQGSLYRTDAQFRKTHTN